jgi:hypothetical protein
MVMQNKIKSHAILFLCLAIASVFAQPGGGGGGGGGGGMGPGGNSTGGPPGGGPGGGAAGIFILILIILVILGVGTFCWVKKRKAAKKPVCPCPKKSTGHTFDEEAANADAGATKPADQVEIR